MFRAGDEVRITVQLIHGASDTHIWAQSYQRSFSDILALQSEVASAIAEEIKGELSTDGATPMLSYTPVSEVPGANEAFMRARFEQIRETPDALLAAIEHYSQALEADPEFAGAYAGLAGAELMLGMSQLSDLAESLARARVIALKAFEIDPELPEAHDVLALIEEHLGEEMIAAPAGIDAPEPMTEVQIVRMSPSENVGVGVRGGRRGGRQGCRPRLPHRHLSGSGPRIELPRVQARLHIDFRELYAGGPATPGGGGRLGGPEWADGLGGSGPPGPGGPAAQGGGAYRRSGRNPHRGLRALAGARRDVGGPRATLCVHRRVRAASRHDKDVGGPRRG